MYLCIFFSNTNYIYLKVENKITCLFDPKKSDLRNIFFGDISEKHGEEMVETLRSVVYHV